ncbi:hypothetical protein BLL37_17680 [Pseudomonas azotoformans]|uniref:Uncharacterized protein n=1 Tax=Pseudomonas azotoformans TaxID=47878 RepID=A0A1V2JED1_PSEAZ|nr:hypothetical protein BFL39_00250 [Pseudomonas azotoformans]ONH43630.1 hypothetical protein BLL37_17680 [Pseudomonas azotoformans]
MASVIKTYWLYNRGMVSIRNHLGTRKITRCGIFQYYRCKAREPARTKHSFMFNGLYTFEFIMTYNVNKLLESSIEIH